jgi:hypothetical protein
MTFIPSVLSKNDNNNSTIKTSTTNFTGTGTNTTGYNQISIYITSTENSDAGGLEIQFSDDNSTWTTYFKDTYFTNTTFQKNYSILNTYYKIVYSTPSANFTINSRLNTETNKTNNQTPYESPSNSFYDAFGKLRVTNPYTLLDIKFPSETTANPEFLNNNMLITSKSSGLGTATYGSSKSVLSSSGIGSYINQSRKYCIYQPGKSLLFLGSGIIIDASASSSNYYAQLGYYDTNNGLFFKKTQTGLYVVLRNNTTDTEISQTNWNIDSLDGTGTSGYILDFTKNQLFVIDFEWLSVGRIRFGFYIFGQIYYCHQISNLNNLTEPYMLNPNLPIRYELNVADSGSASLTQICSSVISEGGYNPIGRPFSISNGTTAINTSATETAILALRGISSTSSSNNQYYHQNIVPSLISIFGTSNPDFIFRLRLYLAPNSPTVSTWNSVDPNSVTQYALGGTNITNITNTNIVVDSSYAQGKGSVVFQSLDGIFSNLIQITSNIDNVSDVLVLTAQTLSNSAQIYATINWNESY